MSSSKKPILKNEVDEAVFKIFRETDIKENGMLTLILLKMTVTDIIDRNGGSCDLIKKEDKKAYDEIVLAIQQLEDMRKELKAQTKK